MKRYRVRITDKAKGDVGAVLAWFRDQAADSGGDNWFAQLMTTLDSLETMPERCALAAEAAEVGLDVREILIGKRRGAYRVLFQIQGPVVHILRIWHSARDAVTRDELSRR